MSGSTRKTQAERRAASERALLTATAELIVEHGLGSTSLADIGRRAGYSHALVNHLFGTKLCLAERLSEAVDEYYAERAAQLPAGTGADTLLAFIDLYLTLVTGPDPLGRVHVVLWTEAIAGIPEIRPSRVDRDRFFRQGITTMIDRGIADGSVRADIDPGATSLVIVGLLRGVALQLLLENDDAKTTSARQAVSSLARTMLERPRPLWRTRPVYPDLRWPGLGDGGMRPKAGEPYDFGTAWLLAGRSCAAEDSRGWLGINRRRRRYLDCCRGHGRVHCALGRSFYPVGRVGHHRGGPDCGIRRATGAMGTPARPSRCWSAPPPTTAGNRGRNGLPGTWRCGSASGNGRRPG